MLPNTLALKESIVNIKVEGESLETAKDNIALLVRSLIKLGVIRNLISGAVLFGEEEIPFDGEHLSSICVSLRKRTIIISKRI